MPQRALQRLPKATHPVLQRCSSCRWDIGLQATFELLFEQFYMVDCLIVGSEPLPLITNPHRTTITGRVALKEGPVARIR